VAAANGEPAVLVGGAPVGRGGLVAEDGRARIEGERLETDDGAVLSRLRSNWRTIPRRTAFQCDANGNCRAGVRRIVLVCETSPPADQGIIDDSHPLADDAGPDQTEYDKALICETSAPEAQRSNRVDFTPPSALSRTSARRAEAQLWRKFHRIVARDLDPVDLPRSSDLEPEDFGAHKYVVVSQGATDHTQKKSLHAARAGPPRHSRSAPRLYPAPAGA
jgi:hypothetical protein